MNWKQFVFLLGITSIFLAAIIDLVTYGLRDFALHCCFIGMSIIIAYVVLLVIWILLAIYKDLGEK